MTPKVFLLSFPLAVAVVFQALSTNALATDGVSAAEFADLHATISVELAGYGQKHLVGRIAQTIAILC